MAHKVYTMEELTEVMSEFEYPKYRLLLSSDRETDQQLHDMLSSQRDLVFKCINDAERASKGTKNKKEAKALAESRFFHAIGIQCKYAYEECKLRMERRIKFVVRRLPVRSVRRKRARSESDYAPETDEEEGAPPVKRTADGRKIYDFFVEKKKEERREREKKEQERRAEVQKNLQMIEMQKQKIAAAKKKHMEAAKRAEKLAAAKQAKQSKPTTSKQSAKQTKSTRKYNYKAVKREIKEEQEDSYREDSYREDSYREDSYREDSYGEGPSNRYAVGPSNPYGEGPSNPYAVGPSNPYGEGPSGY